MNSHKYVVLEHLQLPNRGFRFWSLNTENNTHSHTGELWYKEILFTDDEEEAIAMSRTANREAIPSHDELELYWKEEIEKERNLQELNAIELSKEKPSFTSAILGILLFLIIAAAVLAAGTFLAAQFWKGEF